jgi:hypothetical protein
MTLSIASGRPFTAAVTFAALLAAAWTPAPARAAWRATSATTVTVAYNNGITFDRRDRAFFFSGVSSATNSGLYRTDSRVRVTAANPSVIPTTKEGYNHIGDLSFDAVRRRVLLPLECYYPALGGNTCGVGAIGVADPLTLRFLYYVNLDAAQIKKAMWSEISPDGRWIWTSSGRHLLLYRAAAVSREAARRQRSGSGGAIRGKDMGAVLPASGVTGATFYKDALSKVPRLLLALNRGTYSEVVSYRIGTARDGSPTILCGPTRELRVERSPIASESEGLTVAGVATRAKPLGGVLDWLMLPKLTPSTLFSRILSYAAAPALRLR